MSLSTGETVLIIGGIILLLVILGGFALWRYKKRNIGGMMGSMVTIEDQIRDLRKEKHIADAAVYTNKDECKDLLKQIENAHKEDNTAKKAQLMQEYRDKCELAAIRPINQRAEEITKGLDELSIKKANSIGYILVSRKVLQNWITEIRDKYKITTDAYLGGRDEYWGRIAGTPLAIMYTLTFSKRDYNQMHLNVAAEPRSAGLHLTIGKQRHIYADSTKKDIQHAIKDIPKEDIGLMHFTLVNLRIEMEKQFGTGAPSVQELQKLMDVISKYIYP